MSTPWRARWLAIHFAATIFVSAFLLFQIQPLVSKYILPWFGGTAAVWTTCMLFFQTLLFGGYAYAHLSQRLLRPKMQAGVHLGLLVLALALLHVVPSDNWKPKDSTNPVGQILLLLAGSVGVPYFALSSTGPLVQAWFARMFPNRTPYRLYALSNFGSLFALLSYPFLFERLWDVPGQANFWLIGFVVYFVLCGSAAISLWVVFRKEQTTDAGAAQRIESSQGEAAGLELAPATGFADGANRFDKNANLEAPIPWLHRALWLALPAFASLTLLATTNHVCTDVAPVPFLWVAPLSLYLLTFIIAFDHSGRYRPVWIAAVTLPSIYLVATIYSNGLSDINLFDWGLLGKLLHAISDQWASWHGLTRDHYPKTMQFSLGYGQYVALIFEAMFGICMLCHGELVRLRPHPRHLTEYYLMIAAGGALGGAAVTLLAPLIFRTFFEFVLAMIGGFLLALAIFFRSYYRIARNSSSVAERGRLWWIAPVGTAPLLLLAAIWLCELPGYFNESDPHRQLAVRNFFGTLSVLGEYTDRLGDRVFTLKHGGIMHGQQFTDAERRYKPTTYFTENSGVGRTIAFFRDHSSHHLQMGVVGLGIGTLAAYIQKDDSIQYYEINPAVIEIAESSPWFTYLQDCRQRGGKYQIKLGDARLTLERELKEYQPQRYQILVLDAFSGDAIPVHLLTEEAFRTYLDHLATAALDGEDGAIAIHISNRYIDLEPVVRGAAEKFGLREVHIICISESKNGAMPSDWVILTRNDRLADTLAAGIEKPAGNPRGAVVWTDARSNLFDLLK